ncbi:pyruvate kinase [Verrucomicrobiota bacterium]
MRKAKILATLGPASASPEVVSRLIECGADAFRFNFSHDTHVEHRARLGVARSCAERSGRHIPMVQDLQGAKIRVDLADRGPVLLSDEDEVFLSAEPDVGLPDTIRVRYPPLCEDVKPGEPILFDDGKIVLEAEAVLPPKIRCRVRVGGLLRDRKGMNLPGTRTSLSPFTDKDREDLAAGIEMGFDWVALSFVQSADDIRVMRAEMDRLGRQVPVIAKLERPAAVDHLEEILDEADAVMVARGDLGIEIPVQRVPVVQKRVIEAANRKGVTVITATQMLESMTERTTPTRAEVTDVANAVYDGTDVVMLSGETATGGYPMEAARMMREIILEAESFPEAYTPCFKSFSSESSAEDGTTAHLAAQASRDMDIKAICVYTQSGRTAALISKFRPQVDIYAFCPLPDIVTRVGLLWGVTPVAFPLFERSDGLLTAMNEYIFSKGVARPGELVAIAFGSPIPARCPSNMLRLHEVVV